MRILSLVGLISTLAYTTAAHEVCETSPLDPLTQLETANRCAGVICLDHSQCSTMYCSSTEGVCASPEEGKDIGNTSVSSSSSA
jgi:hypothetical protein